MSKAAHSRISRRGVLAGSLAIPVFSTAPASVEGLQGAGAFPDPLIAKAEAWITAPRRLDALTLEWGRLETQVRDKARRLGIEMYAARARRFPEAQAMRALDRRIDAAYRDLEGLAVEASLMRAVTVEGAVAKLDLSMRIQGSYSWQDHARELAEGGIAELRSFTTQRGQLSASA